MCRPITSLSARACLGQGAGSVAKGTVEASSALAKTKMCKFFLRGKCTRGTGCTFAHSQSDLHTAPDLFRTEMCHQFIQTGTCKYGDRCTFAHTADQLRSAPIVSAPTVAAPVWAEWAMPDAAMGSFMYCFTDDLHANLFALGECPASAEPFMHTDSFANPTSMPCVSAVVDREAWCDSEYGDSASTLSLLATVESDGDTESTNASDEDEEEEVNMELVVERTFVTMKVAGMSHRAAVGAPGRAAARRRAVSEPPRERQC